MTRNTRPHGAPAYRRHPDPNPYYSISTNCQTHPLTHPHPHEPSQVLIQVSAPTFSGGLFPSLIKKIRIRARYNTNTCMNLSSNSMRRPFSGRSTCAHRLCASPPSLRLLCRARARRPVPAPRVSTPASGCELDVESAAGSVCTVSAWACSINLYEDAPRQWRGPCRPHDQQTRRTSAESLMTLRPQRETRPASLWLASWRAGLAPSGCGPL